MLPPSSFLVGRKDDLVSNEIAYFSFAEYRSAEDGARVRSRRHREVLVFGQLAVIPDGMVVQGCRMSVDQHVGQMTIVAHLRIVLERLIVVHPRVPDALRVERRREIF